MTFKDLQELLAEQFSCDISEIGRDTEFDELGADHEDMIELAWALGEELDREISENTLSSCQTVAELWRLLQELAEDSAYGTL